MSNKYAQYSKRKEFRQHRSCTSKAVFETKEEAYQKGQTVYHCRYCGKYHRSGALGRLLYRLRHSRSKKANQGK